MPEDLSDKNFERGIACRQAGFALILPLVVIVVLVVLVLLFYTGVIKLPFSFPSNLQNLTQQSKEPSVTVKTEYKNPFEKDSQYVNPFSEYKNPFDSLK